ncbi:MAG: nodulation protein NfeD [archaeon]
MSVRQISHSGLKYARKQWKSALLFLLILVPCIINSAVVAQDTRPLTVVLEIHGTIGFSTVDYVRDGLDYARESNAQSVTILLDTPGGSLDATFEIVKLIDRSDIPVITFVYPQGATGWSAGVFILLSSHVAAMAPGTVIGSSQPRAFPSGEAISDPKIVNALTEFLAERARLHGRNETAAAMFVTKNLNLGAEQAERFGVIEVRADSVDALMSLIHGREVKVFGRGKIQLQTSGARLLRVGPSVRSQILGLISEPTVAYLLFTLGFWVLIFGFSTAGPVGEIVGAILLVLGLIGIGFNIDFLVFALILMGAVLVVAEMMRPGLQIFGPAGIVCLALGSLLLLRLDPSRWLVSQDWYLAFSLVVIGATVSMVGFAGVILYKIFRLPRQRIKLEWIIGKDGRTVDSLSPGAEGYVRVEGEYWRARASVFIEAGQKVTVINKEGAVLTVEPSTAT